MRRKLAYSNPVLTNSMAKLGSLPQGDWHVSKTGGKLFVGDTNWTRYAILGETVNEAEFHLDKTTSMLIQAQDKTTCRDIAIESKPAYDIYVVGGGASELLHRADRAVLSLRRVTADENTESMHRPQGAQETENVGRHVAHRHQGGEWLANRLRRRRGPIAVERLDHLWNGCLRTGRWDNHIRRGESFLRRFGFQGGAGLAAMLKSRTVDGEDHELRLLHRRHRTLLALSLGVAA